MRRIAGTAVAAALAVAAPASATVHTVTFPSGGNRYAPDEVVWLAGDSVTFQGDVGAHPLIWEDAAFAKDETTPDFAAKPAGEYRFYCEAHGGAGGSGMAGVVRKPDGVRPATPSFTAAPSSPTAGQNVTFTASAAAARFEWDLDGDGSFERRTAAASTTAAYATPGDRTVRLRVMEADGDVSDAGERVVSVQPAPPPPPQQPAPPAGDPGTGGIPTEPDGGPGNDTTKPAVKLPRRALRVRGGRATLAFTASEAGRATATVKSGGRTLAAGRTSFTRAGNRTLRLSLTKRGRSRVRRGKVKAALTLVVRDLAGNATTVEATVTLSAAPSAARRRGGSSRR